jgi:hypothetical protein
MKRCAIMLMVLMAVSAMLTVGPLATVTGASPIPHRTSPGYWLLTGYGSTYAYSAPYLGDQFDTVTQSPCQGNDGYIGPNFPSCNGISATRSGEGYWVEDGFGAIPVGDTGSCTFATGPPFTPAGSGAGIAAAPTGAWLAASDGGVFALCGTPFFGSMGDKPLNKPIVGIAATPDGRGYWLVASDGGVFAFGDAKYSGSMGGKTLSAPMVGIAANPDGTGYWTVAEDGGVFAFGDAPFLGSAVGQTLNAPIVGMASRG